MDNAENLDDLEGGIREKEPVVADPQPQLFSVLERLHIARSRFRETMQCRENPHGGRFVQGANIRFGRFRPDNPLHFDSLLCSISSAVIPSSAST